MCVLCVLSYAEKDMRTPVLASCVQGAYADFAFLCNSVEARAAVYDAVDGIVRP